MNNISVKNVMAVLALLTCIGGPLGLWINMQIKDAEHDLQIKANEKRIVELKKEIKENKDEYNSSVYVLSNKIDAMPQKILDLMNSVQTAKNNN